MQLFNQFLLFGDFVNPFLVAWMEFERFSQSGVFLMLYRIETLCLTLDNFPIPTPREDEFTRTHVFALNVVGPGLHDLNYLESFEVQEN